MDTSEDKGKDINRILRDTFSSQSESSLQGRTQPELVRTSRLAVLACVLAVVSLLLLPGLIPIFRRTTPQYIREAYSYATLLTALCAAVLGVVALSRMGLRGGRLAGRGFAWAGIAAPVVQWLLFLVIILPATPRSRAFRMTCGTHLSGIGKAMLLYANDNDNRFPRAGGRRGVWAARTPSWAAESPQQAYGLSDPNAEDGRAGISASLYLLVKHTEVTPRVFVCTGDKGTAVFTPTAYGVDSNMVDLWDFGPNPPRHCSYAYQMVYGPFELTASGVPGLAIAADRNPWMDSPSVKASDFSKFLPDIAPFNGTAMQGLAGNTFRHEGQGQNVIFLDTHVDFLKRPFCGLDDDNIYTSWNGQDKTRGVPPQLGSAPADATDSLVVNDPILSSK